MALSCIVSHVRRDIGRKSRNWYIPPVFNAPTPSEFRREVWVGGYSTLFVVPHTQGAQASITQCYLQLHQCLHVFSSGKTRITGLPYAEESMTMLSPFDTMLQHDGWTESRVSIAVQMREKNW